MEGASDSRRGFLRKAALAGAGLIAGCATGGGEARPPRRARRVPRRGGAKTNIGISRAGSARDSSLESVPADPAHDAAQPAPVRQPMAEGAVIRCAVVGVGGWGGALLQEVLARDDVRVVALADAYDVWRNRALHWCARKTAATGYVEFEEMLENEDLDAVLVATPDHTHGAAVRAALERGADVYVEAPLAKTWEEAQALGDLATQRGAVVQMGTQLRSDPMYQYARSVVREGDIGKIVAVEVQRHYQDQPLSAFEPPREATEKNVHWKTFLGEAPRRRFDLVRFFRWPCYRDYTNDNMGILLAPHLDMCHFITGSAMPNAVMSAGGIYAYDDGRTCPDTFSVICTYPQGFQFNFLCAPSPSGAEVSEFYHGFHGRIEIHDMTRMVVYREDSREEWAPPAEGRGSHMANFLDSVRTRQAPLAPINGGVFEAICSHMAVLSQETGHGLAWDGAREPGSPALAAR